MEIAIGTNANLISIEMRLVLLRVKCWILAGLFAVRLLLGSHVARRELAEMEKRVFRFCNNRDRLVAFGINEERAGLALIANEYPAGRKFAVQSLAKILAAEFSHARIRWIENYEATANRQTARGIIRRAARAIGSSVRQSFATRSAAKAADGGGGDPDPDGRHTSSIQSVSRFTSPVFAFQCGGAK